MNAFIGVDTSCYTTSVACVDEKGIVCDHRTVLSVKPGLWDPPKAYSNPSVRSINTHPNMVMILATVVSATTCAASSPSLPDCSAMT